MFPLRDSTQSASFPLATVFLILINLFVYFQESLLSEIDLYYLANIGGLIPARFTSPDSLFHGFATFFSSMFLHGSWTHVIGNMWMLWLFGDNVEDHMGKLRFLLFYLMSGVIASAVHCIMFPFSAIPVVGASGAVAGIMGAYFIMFKHASIITLIFPFFIVRIPAVFYLGIWALMQLLSGTGMHHAGDSIAFWSHVGGFAAGMLLYRHFLKAEYRNPVL